MVDTSPDLVATRPSRRRFQFALLSYGFRPFFLFGALWALIAIAIWIAILAGSLDLPTRFDPISWHSHEFLFGYLSAIIAGFLLTAVPNWTGRQPLSGWPLGGLVLVWIVGRLAIGLSAFLPSWLVAASDLLFPFALGAVTLREIVVSKNWRNLIILILLAVFTLANGVFHLEAWSGAYPAQGIGLRLGLAAGLMMIGVVGGRIIPLFTRNWLIKMGKDVEPALPMQAFDIGVLVVTLIGLAFWVIWPNGLVTGYVLLLVAGLQLMRFLRWKGWTTLAEPLVWVLHVAYAFLPLGAALTSVSILAPAVVGGPAALHVWMVGAIGLMTLAVMTRATLGHTGQELKADIGSTLIYIALVASVVLRLIAGFWVDQAPVLYTISGVFWIMAFGSFVIRYSPLLLTNKTAEAG